MKLSEEEINETVRVARSNGYPCSFFGRERVRLVVVALADKRDVLASKMDDVAGRPVPDGKHSPGPWRACGHKRGLCVCGQVWSVARDMPVATVFKGDDEVGELTEGEWKANAALIARTPELLAELDAAVKLLRRWLDDDGTEPLGQPEEDTRAFLARHEGRR